MLAEKKPQWALIFKFYSNVIDKVFKKILLRLYEYQG